MKINNKELVALRKKTGIAILECRNALVEADGDLKLAEDILKRKGVEIADKKATRVSKQGVVDSYIHAGSKIGALVEISCETDFVARNTEFCKFVHDIAMQVVATDPKDIPELLKQPFIKNEDIDIKTLLCDLIAKIGENIEIKRFERYEITR